MNHNEWDNEKCDLWRKEVEINLPYITQQLKLKKTSHCGCIVEIVRYQRYANSLVNRALWNTYYSWRLWTETIKLLKARDDFTTFKAADTNLSEYVMSHYPGSIGFSLEV